MTTLICRILISQINTNHEVGSPEALARNAVLIRELNKNIAEVSHSVLASVAISAA